LLDIPDVTNVKTWKSADQAEDDRQAIVWWRDFLGQRPEAASTLYAIVSSTASDLGYHPDDVSVLYLVGQLVLREPQPRLASEVIPMAPVGVAEATEDSRLPPVQYDHLARKNKVDRAATEDFLNHLFERSESLRAPDRTAYAGAGSRRSPTRTRRLREELAALVQASPTMTPDRLLSYWDTAEAHVQHFRLRLEEFYGSSPPDRSTLQRNWPKPRNPG
jgi:hypothetical protein